MKIIGHRGASDYKPENTLESFKEATRMGVHMIELDVYVIKSGEVVVFHDDTLDRTTNGHGAITDITFDELRKLDAGNGQRVPLLTEALDAIGKKTPVNIELKGPNTAEPVAKIIDHYMMKKRWPNKSFLVSAFDHNELNKLSDLMPKVPISYLYRKFSSKSLHAIGSKGIFSANLSSKFLTKKDVSLLHSKGIKVYAYTVNSKRDIKRMHSLNVDGVFTDFPDRILAFRS